MLGCLLNKLSPMHQNKSLSGIFAFKLHSINQVCEYYLKGLDLQGLKRDASRTVFPLPVAKEIPSRLCP